MELKTRFLDFGEEEHDVPFLAREGDWALIPVAWLLTLVGGVWAQAADTREPWQPQVLQDGEEPDARLLQSVEVEILGRAVDPALALLAEKTQVALRVDPRYQETVGERKLTVIARGCSLKAIMVQLQEALQECYWVVDWGSVRPSYTLLVTRQAAVSSKVSGQAASFAEADRKRAAGRIPRQERLQAARQGLAMSPQELKQLELDDLLLARALQHSEMRANIEFILSLPPAKLEELIATGWTSVSLEESPKALQEKVPSGKTLIIRGNAASGASSARWRVSVAWGASEDDDLGAFSLYLSRGDGGVHVQLDYAIPSRWGGCEAAELLAATGTEPAEAERISQQLREGVSRAEARADARKRRWRESGLDPDTPVKLPSRPMDLTELHQAVAAATGLSIVSDAWSLTLDPPAGVTSSPVPMWQLLQWIEDRGDYVVRKAGSCLVLHRQDWYDLIAQEVPEAFLALYAKQLATGRELSIADALSLTLTLGDRPVRLAPDPEFGEVNLRSYREMLALYASLTAEQREKAQFATGLRLGDLSKAQTKELARFAKTLMARMEGIDKEPAFRVTARVASESLGRRLRVVFYAHYEHWHVHVGVRLLLPSARRGGGGD